MSWKHNGARIIYPGRAWTDDDGYQHPANWLKIWDEASRTEKGLSWEDDPAINHLIIDFITAMRLMQTVPKLTN